MSGGGESSGGGGGEIRYAPYIEDEHRDFLGKVFTAISNIRTHNLPDQTNPYGHFAPLNLSAGFFGKVEGDPEVTYELDSFPSLFDMFGKFMGGFDACDLWGKIYENVLHGPEVAAAVSAHSALLQDDIDTTVMPKFLGGMRDINAIQSTAFVVGKGLIASSHVRSVNEFQSKLRLNAIQLTANLWARHLDWNKEVVSLYGEFFKLYCAADIDMAKLDMEFDVKNKLWDLGALDHTRAALGAMAGAPATISNPEPSSGGGVLGGILSGGAAGSKIMPGWGTLIGGVVGAAAAFL